ncbi:MAG: OmpA family protein [Cyanobacteria bacterium CRU_2_1]|nr:OmpA family protein [Cyanobacteria bacterium RU_5_0]NJR58502.1 OmpA family protein [Cyanobacteria bacterium CRU_2_1]
MADMHHPERAKQPQDDSAPSLTESEVLAELFELFNASTPSQPNSSLDAIIQPRNSPAHTCSETSASSTADPDLAQVFQHSADSILENSDSLSPDHSFAELQKLLFNFDQAQLNQLKHRLEEPEQRAADVGQVLRQAILLQSMETEQYNLFVAAMMPTVEQAIQESVQNDEQVIADAIFPIVGPATRKAIATALESTIQRLDQLLEQSLSPSALQWKLESLRTGKSFAEVVLLRTLLFRVEQVFLIHRSTSLLLQHVVAPSVAAQDPALVSAMLQAITDFVQDSFTVQAGDRLETLRFGDLTIWIEQSPQAILAGVLRGQAPVELRVVFRQAIERIHRDLGLALVAFQGDSSPFTAARPHLEACFQTEYKASEHKKGRPYFWALAACVTLGLGIWGYQDWQARHRWTAYLKQMGAEPGIVINSAEKRWGKFFISGLRDPLAIDPATQLSINGINPNSVISQWQPYLSLHPQLMEARAKQILQPPATVSIAVNEAGVLSAIGSAPLNWIEETRTLVRAIPGITQFKNEVAIAELQALGDSRSRIEAQILLFEENTTNLLTHSQTLDALVKEIQTLTQLTALLHRQVRIQIIGRTTPRGTVAQNVLLSQERANAILEILVAKGVQPANLVAIGIGASQPLSNPQIPSDQLNRSVTFKVLFTETSIPRTGSP